MSFIRSIATAFPHHRVSPHEVECAASAWLSDEEQRRLFSRFLSSSHAEGRSFILPPRDVIDLGGMSERAALFEAHALPVARDAALSALRTARVPPDEIATIILTSCSCPVIPAIDVELITALGLPRTVRRMPLYQHGCAAGVIGLARSGEYASFGPVLFVSVELCSLVFQRRNTSTAHLVGAAIFSDGAASAVITPTAGRLRVVASQSYMIENTRSLMGYDIEDDGAHLRLDRLLPAALASHLPKVATQFFDGVGITPHDVNWWLVHPGGTRILDSFQELFSLRPEQMRWSRRVLNRYGNMSSASILFVAHEFLVENVGARGELVIVAGVGPGLTIEFLLLELQ